VVDEVVIDRLVLRVPGISRERAARLAHEVSAALAERLRTAGAAARYDVARLRITVPDDVAPDHLPTAIADRIWEALR
jgi:hypothetical protein